MRSPRPSFIVQAALVAGIVAVPAGAGAGEPRGSPDDHGRDVTAMIRETESLRERGDYARAIDTGRSAVALAEKMFGPDDRRTADAKHACAAASLEVGDKNAAAPLLREALAVLERAAAPDPSAMSSVLGDLAQTIGEPAEAESLYRRAVSLAEAAHGPDHAATGHALNNMGMFLYERARAREAEPLVRRALHIRERMKGMASPLTAQSLCSLGMIASAQGDVSVAESLVRGSLERRRALLPGGHPDIGESSCMLALILIGQGKERADEAATLASDALGIYKATFGPMHERTFLALHAKADALAMLGRRTESERLHQDLIARIESLPSSRADLLTDALAEFGRHMLEAGKPGRAVELCRRAVSLRRKPPGQDDAAGAAARQVLAEALYANHDVEDAVKEGRAVLAFQESNGNEPRLETAAALYALAKYLLGAGGMEEARALLRRSVPVFEQTEGPGSRQTLQAIYLLAVTYIVTDELAEAERLVDDGFQRFLAAADVRTTAVAGDLIGLRGVIYRKTGRIKQAEEAEAVAKRIEADEQR